MTEKYIITTWKEIAKYTPYSPQTLRLRFGKDMIKKGYVLKGKIGHRGKIECWSYPELIQKYFILLNEEKEVI